MIDSVASILAPLLGLAAGGAGADAPVLPPAHPVSRSRTMVKHTGPRRTGTPGAGPEHAGPKRLVGDRPGRLSPIALPSIQFAASGEAQATTTLGEPHTPDRQQATFANTVVPFVKALAAADAIAGPRQFEFDFSASQPMPKDAAKAALAPEAASEVMAPAAGATPASMPAPMPAPMNGRTEAEAGPIVVADDALLNGRKRPGFQKGLPERIEQMNTGAVRPPAPEAYYAKAGDVYPDGIQRPELDVALPDRWRITSTLCPSGGDRSIYTLYPNLKNVCRSKLDPFNHNLLKGDRPLSKKGRPSFLKGDDWFFIASAISDTIVEPRSFPIPVGNQTTGSPDQNDTFGRSHSLVLAQTFIVGASLLKGMTAFKPPSVEYRIALAGQVNYVNVPERRVLSVRPSKNSQRTDHFLGVQELFVDYHLGQYDNSRFDFFSVRAGIQPIQQDFRGFLFQDNQLGIRLFGNRDNNRFQFNLGAFWRLEKDTNSGLNSVVQRPRGDWVFIANVYRQDFPVVGLTSQVSVTYNMNRESDNVEIDDNGFPARPALIGDLRGRSYDVVYLGYATDGRIGRINLTSQLYGAFGQDRNSVFTSEKAKIRAFFAAAEASYDVDFLRFRLSALYASGDGNPYDNTERGFSAIFENPIFAGADTSYRIRQSIPFAGGGRAIVLNGRNAILNDVRSSKEQGQSNFNNPGTILLGAGVDADLTPTFRLSGNATHYWFDNTATLQALRVEGSIPKTMGWDLSTAAIWRPLASQNVVLRLSGAVFEPSKGFNDLFDQQGKGKRFYSVLANIILAY